MASALPFPPISWWKKVVEIGVVYLDPQEHFEKMSFRNRYYLASKTGEMMLSLPLVKAPNHAAMKDIQVSYAEDWQKNHWKTIQTLLGNSPFFEYIDYQLFPFFQETKSSLYEWNKASIIWANQFMGSPLTILEMENYSKNLDENVLDLRSSIHPKIVQESRATYQQVFETKTLVSSHYSILDLICCEGKNALNILRG